MSGQTLCWSTKQTCIKVHMKQHWVDIHCYIYIYTNKHWLCHPIFPQECSTISIGALSSKRKWTVDQSNKWTKASSLPLTIYIYLYIYILFIIGMKILLLYYILYIYYIYIIGSNNYNNYIETYTTRKTVN